MKLGTLKSDSRDGMLVVVSRDHSKWSSAAQVAANLQVALDNWDQVKPKLEQIYKDLNEGRIGQKVILKDFHSPLPRAYEWVDASSYINHVVLVRKARNAEPPATLRTDPLVYQGGSGTFLGPYSPIPWKDDSWGLDFESEVCVILGDTPMFTKASDASQYVRLVMIANDVSLRGLIPAELEKGFGFFGSKPSTAFSPFCITPDELGPAWKEGRVHLELTTKYNGTVFGTPNAGPEMHFSFFELIEHITKTRSYTAGTILGSGTVSNEDISRGSSCLAEKRMLEIINHKSASTPFMKPGDTVEIEMFGSDGKSLFGKIHQLVEKV
jgi:fumarylacetoacetate (FAA) hydrolase